MNIRQWIGLISTAAFLFGMAPHATGEAISSGSYFNSSKEFPVLFLPPAYRGLPRQQIPSDIAHESLARLEAAMASIFARLEVPMVVDGKLQSVRYFSYMDKELKEIDRSIQLVPSGGVVRALISYIYYSIYTAMQTDPSRSAESILNQIIHETNGIPAYEIRGVGSDFDVLLYRYSKDKFDKLISRAAALTNSAEAGAGMRYSDSALKRAFFTIADFKDYTEQLNRATRQGGSDIDFLAFDLVTGHLIVPPSISGGPDYSQIALNLVCGFSRYLAPVDSIEDSDKQTVRGVRPLVELPFLNFIDDSRIRQELTKLIERLAAEKRLSSKAFEQFAKLVRNARFNGGHNRIYRGAPGSLEELILKLVKSVPREKYRLPVIPEFVDQLPLGRHSNVPQELLIPVDQFVQHHTDGGILYHGTPEVDKSMAILRGGLFVSGGAMEQGGYAYGRGAYLSKDRSVSRGYASGRGLVFDLKFRVDPRLRILDWEKAKNHPWIQQLKVAHPNQDIFELLARQQGIDVILHHHVLLQNMAAIRFNGNLEMVLHSLHQSLESMIDAPDETFNAKDFTTQAQEYQNLAQFYRVVGGATLPELNIQKIVLRYRSRLESGRSKAPKEDFDILNRLSTSTDIDRAAILTDVSQVILHPQQFGLTRQLHMEYVNLLRDLRPTEEQRQILDPPAIDLYVSYEIDRLFNKFDEKTEAELKNLHEWLTYGSRSKSQSFWKQMHLRFPGKSDDALIQDIILPNLKNATFKITMLFGDKQEERVLELAFEDLIQKSHVADKVTIAENAFLLPQHWKGFDSTLNRFLQIKYVNATVEQRLILDALDRQWRAKKYDWKYLSSIANEDWRGGWTEKIVYDSRFLLVTNLEDSSWKKLQLSLFEWLLKKDDSKEPYDRLDHEARDFVRRAFKTKNTEVIRLLFIHARPSFLAWCFENKWKYRNEVDYRTFPKDEWLGRMAPRAEAESTDVALPLLMTFVDHNEPFQALRFGLGPNLIPKGDRKLWARYFAALVRHADIIGSDGFQELLSTLTRDSAWKDFDPHVAQGKIKRSVFSEFQKFIAANPNHSAKQKINQFLDLNRRDPTDRNELLKLFASSAPLSEDDLEVLVSDYGTHSPNSGLIARVLMAKGHDISKMILKDEDKIPLFQDMLTKRDLSKAIMKELILPEVIDPLRTADLTRKRVFVLASKILMNQKSWDSYIYEIWERIVYEYSRPSYETQVSIYRRLAKSSPETWKRVKDLFDRNRDPLVAWMFKLRASNFSSNECSVLLLGNFEQQP